MGETIDRYSSGSAGRRLTMMVLTAAVARRHVVHDCGRFTERWGWLVPSGLGARSWRGLRRPERGGWSAAFNLIKQVVEIALHLGEEVVAFLQLVDQRDYFLSWTLVMIVLPELENEFHLLISVEFRIGIDQSRQIDHI